MTTKLLGPPPQQGGNNDRQPSFDLNKRLAKVDWTFADVERRYLESTGKKEPVGIIGLYIPTKQVEFVLDLYRFNFVGRSYPHSDAFDGIDFSPFDAYSLGVSRRHIVFIYEKPDLIVVDKQSTNGTYLNRAMLKPLQPYIVKNDDTIRMGGFEFVVRRD